MCLHPLLACTHSALSKVVPERGYLLHTPSCHGAARTAQKIHHFLLGEGQRVVAGHGEGLRRSRESNMLDLRG